MALDLTQAIWTAVADLVDPPPRNTWATPGALAVDLDRTTVQTPALDLIDQALVDVAEGRTSRLIISMPPQQGKSQRCSRWLPLWLLHRNPDLRIAIASYEHGVARRWGRAIRNDIATHGERLHLTVRPDTSAAHEWQLDGKNLGGVYSVGIGGALTGRPVEFLIIDDPVKDRQQADSPTIRENVWDWWTNVARTRLAPGAPVVLILTRWHEDDLAGRLIAASKADPDAPDAEPWTVLNIPALADHRPERGETDPLGRQPGEWMTSARGTTIEQWEQTRRAVGSRVFVALYQGRPSPGEGVIFHRDWWQSYDLPQWTVRGDGVHLAVGFDEVIQSWDMAFKKTEGSDFVAGQVWGRRGIEAFLLDQVCRRMTFTETCDALRQLSAKWPQAVLKLVEDKANGTAVINALSRTVPGMVPIEPDGSKVARASAVSPFVQARSVWLPAPEIAPWVGGLIGEAASFPRGQHDDQVDALSQALNRLLLRPLLDPDEVFELDDDEDDEVGISRY